MRIKKDQKVRHPDFGDGIVTNPNARNGWIIVDFPNALEVKCAESRLTLISENPEAVLRDALQAADDAFSAVAMRDGVTRPEIETARKAREDASDKAHAAYRDRFNSAGKVAS